MTVIKNMAADIAPLREEIQGTIQQPEFPIHFGWRDFLSALRLVVSVSVSHRASLKGESADR
jgi:hypothetical protein